MLPQRIELPALKPLRVLLQILARQRVPSVPP
jgi:hypothetical protein